jgi:hypothetical protein
MQRWRIILVGTALLVVAWVMLSTLPVQGAWQARLYRGDSATPFAFHVTTSRSGVDGWLDRAGGAQALDAFSARSNRLRFDLPLDGHRYRLDGRAHDHHIEGTWRDETGATGTWQADHVRRR